MPGVNMSKFSAPQQRRDTQVAPGDKFEACGRRCQAMIASTAEPATSVTVTWENTRLSENKFKSTKAMRPTGRPQ